jgi:polysaccharide pyruvyl transferase WcaK-like protein
MIIGLLGFEFCTANKGCEALAYSFLNVINCLRTDQSITIYNFTRYGLGLVPDYFKTFKFEKKNISFKNIKLKYFKNFKECDIIFDVTMGDSFSDIYSLKLYRKTVIEKYFAEKFCHKYVSLPQTYGPFYNKSSLFLAKKILKNASAIFCRDEMSQRYLEKEMGIKDSILSSDMAFMLPYTKDLYKFSNKGKVGINISGLLYRGGFHSENQFGLSLNYRELIDNLLLTLSDKYEVHLIPHVVDLKQDAYDDDYKTCKMLHEKFPNTVLAPAFDTPIQAKSYISNMDIFVGSRMHSTIASFSSGVVTIPISYSRKFEGLFGSLNYPYVINAREESTESALKLINQYLECSEQLLDTQVSSLQIMEKKNEQFCNSIKKILNEAKK